jgi:hypothetical protein
MVYIFLSISVIFNGILAWFIYRLINKYFEYSENINFLVDYFDDFVSHLESIYKMEMFYGEETLKGLLDHSKNVKIELDTFKENYLLEMGDDEETYDDETPATD